MQLHAMRAQVVLAVAAATAALAAPSYNLVSTIYNSTSFTNQPYVSNGYIGQRIPAEGFGYQEFTAINASGMDGTNGWPLFDSRFTAAMVAGFYDQQINTTGTNFAQTGGEQPISTLPTWSSLYLTVNGETFAVGTPEEQITNYTQSMSIQDGVVRTGYKWTPSGGNFTIGMNYTIFAHRVMPNLGVVRLDLDGLVPGMNVSFTDVLDGAGSWRTTFVESGILSNYTNSIFTAVQPNGITNVTAYEASVVVVYPFTSPLTTGPTCLPATGVLSSINASTISQCYSTAIVPENGKMSAIKYVGIASSDAFPGVEFETALHSARHANATGYTDILSSHTAAWDAIWQDADIIVPGDEGSVEEDWQLVTRASLFHLLSNVREGNEGHGLGDNSIAPAGLTSDSYAGQIFWDADTWMAPSLIALFPSYAESLINFRHRQLGAAQVNAGVYNRSGALYPWTAGRFGNCTGVGPCYDYEYHLNNDISLAQFQYYIGTQNTTWLAQRGWPVLLSIAEFWASQVVYNATTMEYDTLNETDPDEYANFRNNAAYTNAGISVILKHAISLGQLINMSTPSNWSDIAEKIVILTDPQSDIILEYDGFNGTTSVKQADVVLLTYPLEYDQPSMQALADLDFYAQATSPSGPGMTYSIFSIDASALSQVGCASYSYLLAASQPYSRAPFYQFSEQTSDVYSSNGGTNPAFTFLTAHGGFLQSFTHGFTGYRSRLNAMYLDPILPPQLKNYTLKGMKWGTSVLDVTLDTEQTTILHRNGTDSVPVEIASANAKGGNYTIAVGDSLVVPTRSLTGTLVSGNLAQCQNVLSEDSSFQVENPDIVAGQYALSAVDGSNATTWQPNTNASSTMTVDLSTVQSFTKLHFNWGQVPPQTYIVMAGNTTNQMIPVANGSVAISAAYNPATANTVAIKIGNLTDVTLASPIAARYVNVTIEGSYLANGNGGQLAEFAVIT